MTKLVIDNLEFSYDGKSLFSGIHLQFDMPGIYTILGANNCGKTTLIKLLSGVLPTNKCLYLDKMCLTRRNAKTYLKNIGVVFESINSQFITDTVEKELYFPLENLNYSKKKADKVIAELLPLFSFTTLRKKNIEFLSYFQKVKLLVMLSVLHHPKVLFLDDITIGLSEDERRELFSILKELVSRFDLMILLTTSNILDILSSDRTIVLYDGNVVMDDYPKNILIYDNELAKMGIYMPTMIDLSLKLRMYGIIDEVITNVDRMVNKLWD